MTIDWSKAPEWAEGHGLICWQGIIQVWISADQYSLVGSEHGPFPWGGGTGDTRHNHTRGSVEYITPRPDSWSGEGLPPVGTVCEALLTFGRPNERAWRQVNVTFVNPDSGEALVFDAVTFRPGWADELRPIRTPEQIAAEERRRAIQAITKVLQQERCAGDDDGSLSAEAIWDAGYRKVEGGAE